jgi:chromate transporter
LESSSVAPQQVPAKLSVPLRTVAALFLRLGATSFGGPAAHIALMEEEFVRHRQWLTSQEFLDLVGAVNLIPGPNSTELAIHIGHRVAGWRGLIVAGACFILPAALIVGVISWAYVTFGKIPPVAGVLYGVKPVVIAIVVQALFKLAKTCLTTWTLAALAVAAAVLAFMGIHELIILFGTGIFLALVRALQRSKPASATPLSVLALSALPLAPGAVTGAAIPFGLGPLFLFFLKVGSVLFGSGYVLLAFLRADLVERYRWLTEQQLLDAIAVGQVTPGPVFTTATFIGYLLDGTPGAAVATIGIFLPAFVFVALSVPLLPRLRKSAVAGAFLDGVNAASLALMAVVTWQLAFAAVVDVVTAVLALASAVLLFGTRINATWLVLGGAAAGLLRALIMAA